LIKAWLRHHKFEVTGAAMEETRLRRDLRTALTMISP